MLPAAINAIGEADLQQLVQDSAREGKFLEFKRDLPGQADADRVRLLRSITSFSNSLGGDLILGIDAQDGVAANVLGIPDVVEDQVRQRIENLCRDGADPRVPAVSIKFVGLANGNTAIVIRAARSWNAPHRVTSGGHSQFYGRNSAGSYPLDVSELRAAFTMPDRIGNEIHRFREMRIARVQAYDTPVPILNVGLLVFHLMPFSAFSPLHAARLSLDVAERHNFSPFDARGCSVDVNLEGYVIFTHRRQPSSEYTQVYRNGAIESVVAFDLWEGERIYKLPATWIEVQCLRAIDAYMRNLQGRVDVFPLGIGIALVNVADYRFAVPGGIFRGELQRADRNVIELPTAVVENPPLDAAQILRTTYDMMWNAFGYEHSPSYDAQGRFNPAL